MSRALQRLVRWRELQRDAACGAVQAALVQSRCAQDRHAQAQQRSQVACAALGAATAMLDPALRWQGLQHLRVLLRAAEAARTQVDDAGAALLARRQSLVQAQTQCAQVGALVRRRIAADARTGRRREQDDADAQALRAWQGGRERQP